MEADNRLLDRRRSELRQMSKNMEAASDAFWQIFQPQLK